MVRRFGMARVPRSLSDLLRQIITDERGQEMPALRLRWPAGTLKAQARGMRLLQENLSSSQRAQYERFGFFDVIGGETGRCYRLKYGSQMNIEQLDKKGRPVCALCFAPEGDLVAGDVMLAQKLALELFERETLKIANRSPPFQYQFGPMP
jgi:hypothetical protein